MENRDLLHQIVAALMRIASTLEADLAFNKESSKKADAAIESLNDAIEAAREDEDEWPGYEQN